MKRKENEMTAEGELKVWWIPQVPMGAFEVPVDTVEEAALILNVLAEYDAFQLINKVKPDYANAGGLVVFEDGEWCDWEGDEDHDFADDPVSTFPQINLGWCDRLGEIE